MASVDPAHVLRGHASDVQSLAFLSEEHLYAGDSNGEVRLWDLNSCRTELAARLHDANAGILQLACLPAHGILVSQGRDGCVKLWAVGRTGALDRSQPLCETRTESFNFCRCAIWAPGAAAPPAVPGASASTSPAAEGGLRGLLVACAASDPTDVAVWRPAEGRTAGVLLRQGGASETKHGMCMSLAFLAPQTSPPAPPPRQHPQPREAQTPGCGAAGSPPQAAAAASDQRGAEPVPVVPPGAATSQTCDAAAAEDDTLGRRSRSCKAAGEPGDSGASCSGSGSAGGGTATDPWFVVAGYEDGVVALWDVRNPRRPLGSLRMHGEPVMCVDVRARGRAPGRSREAERRRRHGGPEAAAATGEGLGQARDDGGSGGDMSTAGAPTGGTASYDLVSGSADDQISCCVVRPAEARPLVLERHLRLREAGTADVRIRGDGKLFACGCWDGRVRLFSLRRREHLAVLKVGIVYRSDAPGKGTGAGETSPDKR
ncbi:hypothetical protein PLESTB_000083400 [Pleodorina starrii]|uniref:Uncharacterized protein n=1 Tax=Pleodorina starrii TaxID=330485 RepID=A0A9W6BB52_9CHLO|nr:hypothetical protein PLESTB_000083400 [Pleodorina starrii]